MARTVGPAGMMDIRSAAILEDLTYAGHPCSPGSTQTKRQRYYGSDFFKEMPEGLDRKNLKKFDRPKDWIHCSCAAFICMVVLGILHSIVLLHPNAKYAYKMGTLEVTVIAAATYSIAFCFGPMAACLVRCMGHRLTCISGLLMFFIGLVLDALEIHILVYYVAHLGLIGLGSSFALTAAASSVVRHFQKKLEWALILVFITAPLGTAIFHILLYVFTVNTTLSYKWIVLFNSFLVLASIGLTHPLPTSIRPPRHPNPFYQRRKNSVIVQECVGKVGESMSEDVYEDCECAGDTFQYIKETNDNKEEDESEACLCVCVFDISALTDFSFLLWAAVSSCAVITLYVPYLFIIWYANVDFSIDILDGIYIILCFCLASFITRVYIVSDADHTFLFNRTVFQVGCVGSGVIYLLLQQATTYSWLLVWGLIAGVLEGLVVGSIPRLTLLTIPRRYMTWSWSYVVFFNSLALIIGPFLIVSVRQTTGGDIGLACSAIGIIQIGGGILTFFIPNEEYFEDEENAVANAESTNEPESIIKEEPSELRYQLKTPTPVLEDSNVSRNVNFISSISTSNVWSSGQHITDYACSCPVCAKIGYKPCL